MIGRATINQKLNGGGGGKKKEWRKHFEHPRSIHRRNLAHRSCHRSGVARAKTRQKSRGVHSVSTTSHQPPTFALNGEPVWRRRDASLFGLRKRYIVRDEARACPIRFAMENRDGLVAASTFPRVLCIMGAAAPNLREKEAKDRFEANDRGESRKNFLCILRILSEKVRFKDSGFLEWIENATTLFTEQNCFEEETMRIKILTHASVNGSLD